MCSILAGHSGSWLVTATGDVILHELLKKPSHGSGEQELRVLSVAGREEVAVRFRRPRENAERPAVRGGDRQGRDDLQILICRLLLISKPEGFVVHLVPAGKHALAPLPCRACRTPADFPSLLAFRRFREGRD